MSRSLFIPVLFCSLLLNVTAAHADWRSVKSVELANPIRCGYRLLDNPRPVSGVFQPNMFPLDNFTISGPSETAPGTDVYLYFPIPESKKLGIEERFYDQQSQREYFKAFTTLPKSQCAIVAHVTDKGLKRPVAKNVSRQVYLSCSETDMVTSVQPIADGKFLLQSDCGN